MIPNGKKPPAPDGNNAESSRTGAENTPANLRKTSGNADNTEALSNFLAYREAIELLDKLGAERDKLRAALEQRNSIIRHRTEERDQLAALVRELCDHLPIENLPLAIKALGVVRYLEETGHGHR